MAVFPKKLDVERLFRPPPRREAAPSSRPSSGKPGSWRVVTADGMTTVSELGRRAGVSRDSLLNEQATEVVLRRDRGGRPTTIKLLSPRGQRVSLAELELVDTEASDEQAKADAKPAAKPETMAAKPEPTTTTAPPEDPLPSASNINMPRAAAPSSDLFRDKALRRVTGPPPAKPGWFARFTSRKKKADLFEIRLAPSPGGSKQAVDAGGIDLDLMRVIELWPTLSSRVRDAVLVLVTADR